MEITEVRVTLRDEDRLKAFASITFDHCFVVRGLKVILGTKDLFVSMPSRRRKDGTYQDLAHPITNEMRTHIEESVLAVFASESKKDGVRAPATIAGGDDVFVLEDEVGGR